MLKRLKKNLAVLSCFTILAAMGACQAYANEIITFGPRETKIEGSIKYTLIGRYIAYFKKFKGRITLDERSDRIQSVYLEIEAASIESNCPTCDQVARSRRLLYAARYPKIIFKSDKIIHNASGYQVKGVLEMHGIKARMTFPFNFETIIEQGAKRKWLELKGRWIINRKDFNIIWNKYLDHGGILVSDDFIVNWGISTSVRL